MSKSRSQPKRPIAKASEDAPKKVKLAAHAPTVRTPQAAGKKQPRRKVKLHRSEAAETAQAPARQVPWWVFPANERMLAGHGPGPHPGPAHGPGHGPAGIGPGHPGPGGLHPGPGPFPPGPGHHPGPGPFPPGPGGWHPGPGPFPPGPGPFPPGPGPFPPGPGPFPPGPPPRPPLPIPIPIPIPIPGPGPIPQPLPPQAFISVRVDGGFAFPGVSEGTYVPFFPGITIAQALQASGLVAFGPGGGIVAVSGIRIAGRVGLRIRYNGRLIPESALQFPADPNSSIVLELFTF